MVISDLAQKGLGEKVPIAVSCVAAFICGTHASRHCQGSLNVGSGFILAYVRSWKLALAMTSIIPVIVSCRSSLFDKCSQQSR